MAQDIDNYLQMIEEIEDFAIQLLDSDGYIQSWNRGAERIKGYRKDEIIGKNFRIFYTKEDQEKLLPESLLERAKKQRKASVEGWRVKKDGSLFWGSIVIAPL